MNFRPAAIIFAAIIISAGCATFQDLFTKYGSIRITDPAASSTSTYRTQATDYDKVDTWKFRVTGVNIHSDITASMSREQFQTGLKALVIDHVPIGPALLHGYGYEIGNLIATFSEPVDVREHEMVDARPAPPVSAPGLAPPSNLGPKPNSDHQNPDITQSAVYVHITANGLLMNGRDLSGLYVSVGADLGVFNETQQAQTVVFRSDGILPLTIQPDHFTLPAMTDPNNPPRQTFVLPRSPVSVQADIGPYTLDVNVQ